MKNEPCIRFGMRIRPKIKEKPDDSRNSSPPRARLLIARIAACAAVICVIERRDSTHLTAGRNRVTRVATARATGFPPPLRGRDRERGGDRFRSLQPPPSPSLPRKGGGRSPLHLSASPERRA